MTTEAEVQEPITCSVEITPNPADAGAEITVTASVVCQPPCDLVGDTLFIEDSDGNEIAAMQFTAFDEETNASTGSVTLTAPTEVGAYSWTAVLPAFDVEDLSFAAIEVPVDLEVRAHTTKINVWGAPSAIGLGEAFSVNVGIKCICGCSMAGRPFTIHDPSGAQVASGALGLEVWPQTEALYVADVPLRADAPGTGTHSYEVRFPADGLQVPHAAASARFSLTFVPAPEHVVVVEAVDRDKQTPLVGALVAMHPYRATTDASGLAELRVPKGSYTLFVTARKYVSNQASVIVQGDIKTRAQLAIEVRPERM